MGYVLKYPGSSRVTPGINPTTDYGFLISNNEEYTAAYGANETAGVWLAVGVYISY